MATKLSRAGLEKIAQSFRALSESTRLSILQELKSGPKTVNELVVSVGSSQANISKQLSVLREAGFLAREQRGTNALYSISDPLVMDLCQLMCDGINRRIKTSVSSYAI